MEGPERLDLRNIPRGNDRRYGRLRNGRKRDALACLPAHLTAMVGIKGDVMFNVATGVCGDGCIGNGPDRERVMVKQRSDPSEGVEECHGQNEPAVGGPGWQGQYAGGSLQRVGG